MLTTPETTSLARQNEPSAPRFAAQSCAAASQAQESERRTVRYAAHRVARRATHSPVSLPSQSQQLVTRPPSLFSSAEQPPPPPPARAVRKCNHWRMERDGRGGGFTMFSCAVYKAAVCESNKIKAYGVVTTNRGVGRLARWGGGVSQFQGDRGRHSGSSLLSVAACSKMAMGVLAVGLAGALI